MECHALFKVVLPANDVAVGDILEVNLPWTQKGTPQNPEGMIYALCKRSNHMVTVPSNAINYWGEQETSADFQDHGQNAASSSKFTVPYSEFKRTSTMKRMRKESQAPKTVKIPVGHLIRKKSSILSCGSHNLDVVSDAKADVILKAAVSKHALFNKKFDATKEYCLLYPDRTVVDNIPGTNNKFSLDEYQRALGKPFSKLRLYLIEADLLQQKEQHACTSPTPDDGTDVPDLKTTRHTYRALGTPTILMRTDTTAIDLDDTIPVEMEQNNNLEWKDQLHEDVQSDIPSHEDVLPPNMVMAQTSPNLRQSVISFQQDVSVEEQGASSCNISDTLPDVQPKFPNGRITGPCHKLFWKYGGNDSTRAAGKYS